MSRPALYDFQADVIRRISEQIASGADRVLLQLATGAGKTVIAAEMVRRATSKGLRGLFLVHRDFLVQQAMETVRRFGVRCGSLTARGVVNSGAPMMVCMIPTLVRRLDGPFGRSFLPDIIFWDEAHHVAASSSARVAGHYALAATARRRRLYQVGLTATPCRLDGKPLTIFQRMTQGPDMRWLIGNGYLADYRYLFTKTRLAGIRSELTTRMGDFFLHDQKERVHRDMRVIAGETVDLYRRFADGLKAIFFAVSVEHSRETAGKFNAAGIPAEHIDGNTLDFHRREVLARFASGETRVLCNVNIISEGFDVADASCVIMGRHTKSVTMALQQVGRAMRPSPGKEAVIIDQANNYQSVGFPDTERRWSLAGRMLSDQGSLRGMMERVRACEECGYLYEGAAHLRCPQCGHEVVAKGIDIMEYADAEFVERLSRDAERERREEARQVRTDWEDTYLTSPEMVSKVRRIGPNYQRLVSLFTEMGHPSPKHIAMRYYKVAEKIRDAAKQKVG